MAKRTLENIYSRVADATVWLPKKEGQGVLVGNGYLVTAAHCLDYDSDTGMRIALEDHVFYEIETAKGEKMQVAPLVIESCSDVAVLGALDGQTYPPKMVEPFEAFCNRTKSVPLCRRRISGFPAEFRVHIRTHKKDWITGKATIFRDRQPSISIETAENIEGGTSGGPIVNDEGELVGVVSTASTSGGELKTGSCPFARWALPAWIYHRICGREG
jgi:V8-like Glu-specific endopeptidase